MYLTQIKNAFNITAAQRAEVSLDHFSALAGQKMILTNSTASSSQLELIANLRNKLK